MKIKLKDLTYEQYREWEYQNCNKKITNCEKCIFDNVRCDSYLNCCWINHKELYSETFLNQEVEFEEPFLTDEEREYLINTIKPFRDEIVCITKNSYDGGRTEFIDISLEEDGKNIYLLILNFPNLSYKGMILYKEYTLEELGL